MPRGATGGQRLDRVPEPGVHRRRVGGRGPRRARRPPARALPAGPHPLGVGPGGRRVRPGPARRAGRGPARAPRSRWPATTSCRRCWWPTPWSSTTRPASPTAPPPAPVGHPGAAARRLGRSSALAGLVLVTGTLVTGSGPHGGDEAADRLPFAVVDRRPHPQRRGVGVPRSSCVVRAPPGDRGRRRPRAPSGGAACSSARSSPRARSATRSTPPACPRPWSAAHVLGLGARVGRRAALPPRASPSRVPAVAEAPTAPPRPVAAWSA